MSIVPVILAGGSGTRLWPMSRKMYPKQLLNLVGPGSMLQETARRFEGLADRLPPIVICNEDHRFLVAEQMRSAGVPPMGILLEPVGRNTAPAIAVSAFKAMEKDAEALILVLPADHHIRNTEAFCEAVASGIPHAERGRHVTFGIVPDKPETGYGYIRKGDSIDAAASCIAEFVEKPDLATAKTYLEGGNHLWNSGMFLFKASAIIEEMTTRHPEMVAACKKALALSERDLDFTRLDAESFAASPSDSIDYAVMEHTENGVLIPLQAGWSDLGSWDALWEVGEKDDSRNVLKGDVLTEGVTDSFIHSSGRLVTAIGVENLVIVETPDAVMVAPRDRAQHVKAIVEKLGTLDREEGTSHKKVFRPWGNYETVDLSRRFQVKRITVKPGGKLSEQKHFHRAEHWVVVKGTAIVERDHEEILLKEDESVYIPLGAVHRLENPGKIPLELIEVQSGSYLGEDDIVRFEDVYGRNPAR